MIITRKHLPRRAFLQGLGVAVALPMLDAMVPALATASTPAPTAPVRMAFSYVPNGIIMEEFTPAAAGSAYEFTRILKPLEPLREHILVLTGLMDHNGNALGDGGGDHARAASSFLTGVHPKKTAGSDIHVGVSADQIAAAHVGSATQLPSLELGCADSRTVGDCDSGYSCAYTNSISWRGASTPMPTETNPRLAFERLFGTVDYSLSPAERARRARYRISILDLVSERTRALDATLGPSDRHKMNEYLYAVREIEKRITAAENDHHRVVPAIEEPAGIPPAFSDYVKLMYDLQVVAFQTDMTRISTLVIAREGSRRTYGEIGVPDPHHPLTHHRGNPVWIDNVAQINTFHVKMFAYFIDKLQRTQDGDGTLLDHSMLAYGSGISDGNRHTHEDLPVLFAGRGGGAFTPGRHIVYKKQTPVTNLFLTMLDRMGVKPEHIGDSTGELAHLTDL